MKNFIKKVTAVIFILKLTIVISGLAQTNINYGITFASHEVNKDLRTSLDLTSNVPLTLNGNFSISFDISFRRIHQSYGYIFRLIGNDKMSFDLLANSFSGKDHDLVFVDCGRETNVFFELDSLSVIKPKWRHIIFKFDRNKDEVIVSLDGKVKRDKIILGKYNKFKLFFGANDYKKFYTSDVPPMDIRNIKISEHDKPVQFWELKQHNKNRVFDLIAQQSTEVKNASWILDTHARWKKKLSIITSLHPQIAFQQDSGIVHVANQKVLYSYTIADSKLNTFKYKYGSPISVFSNNLRYDSFQKKLIQYDFESDIINTFNKDSLKWDLNETKKQSEPKYWQHNSLISPVDSTLIAFGGYGFFTFKNTIHRYSFKSKKWKEAVPNSIIIPRYLSAAGWGKDSSQIYIFGGYGNPSGKQQLSPESLYDLYTINLKNFKIKKIWELKGADQNFVVANSLIVDAKQKSFYALCFPRHKSNSYLFLGKFSLTKPEFVVVGDSIPYPFEDTQSYADLFYCRQTNELLAVASHIKDKEHAEVNIYSIAFPPIKIESLSQNVPVSLIPTRLGAVFTTVAGIGFLLYFFFYFKKQHSKKPAVVNSPKTITTKEEELGLVGDFKKPTILLLGGLRLVSKDGKDLISGLTPILQHLFVVIFLFSIKSKKGISSRILKEILWVDKSDESAKNNRGVNIRKLRLFLEEIGNINIIAESSSWKIEMGDTIFCDYSRANNLMKIGDDLSEQEFQELLELAKRGALLPEFDYEWLDNFKSAYSHQLTDLLISYSRRYNIGVNDAQLMKIANVMFILDSMSEFALSLKCTLLRSQGKHAIAKNLYNGFIKDYKAIMGIDFHRSFETL